MAIIHGLYGHKICVWEHGVTVARAHCTLAHRAIAGIEILAFRRCITVVGNWNTLLRSPRGDSSYLEPLRMVKSGSVKFVCRVSMLKRRQDAHCLFQAVSGALTGIVLSKSITGHSRVYSNPQQPLHTACRRFFRYLLSHGGLGCSVPALP